MLEIGIIFTVILLLFIGIILSPFQVMDLFSKNFVPKTEEK